MDDDSYDNTSEAARAAGADVVYRHRQNCGVVNAFASGVTIALHRGADITANIDADGQFDPDEIPQLIAPIVDGKADVVRGSRLLGRAAESIPTIKRTGNQIVSAIVSVLVGRRIYDTQSRFRAMSRRAAEAMDLMRVFTHTQQMVMNLSLKRMRTIHSYDYSTWTTLAPCKLEFLDASTRTGYGVIAVVDVYDPDGIDTVWTVGERKSDGLVVSEAFTWMHGNEPPGPAYGAPEVTDNSYCGGLRTMALDTDGLWSLRSCSNNTNGEVSVSAEYRICVYLTFPLTTVEPPTTNTTDSSVTHANLGWVAIGGVGIGTVVIPLVLWQRRRAP